MVYMDVISMGKLEPRNGLNINDFLRNSLNSTIWIPCDYLF